MNKICLFWALLAGLACTCIWGQSAATRAKFYGLPEPAPVPQEPQLPPVKPFEPDFAVGISLDSKYFRDGWCRNSSPVAVGQFEICESGLYLGTKDVFDFSDKAGRGRHFQYANTGHMGPVNVDFCWTYNTYPGDSRENSGEISLALQLSEILKKGCFVLTGGVSLNHNYGKNETYAVADAVLHFSLLESGDLQFEHAFMLFWGDTWKVRRITNGECDGNAFYSAGCQCALPWNVNDALTITPFVEVDVHPDSRARKAAKNDAFNANANVQAGLKLTCHF
ncbi:MAG: hypothetical protein MJ106_02975 [Lentisphaeria bacterium]|nr:hypothetical protein [Lentisphaeria bacterium]